MDLRFVPATFADIAAFARMHHAALPSPVDSFLEDHILASHHYQLEIAGEPAGIGSIHGRSLITQFAMAGPHRRHGQAAFRELRRLEDVRAAFVPTNDAFYLSHALDDYRQLQKQAYLFVHGSLVPEARSQESHALTLATAADARSIRQETGASFRISTRVPRPARSSSPAATTRRPAMAYSPAPPSTTTWPASACSPAKLSATRAPARRR